MASPSSSIRLIDLEDGKDDDIIRCHLRVAHLDENPDFDAISYSWRKDTAAGFIGVGLSVFDWKRFPRYKAIHGRGCAIMCDNQLLRIQENLYDFLLHLRRRKSRRSLWIDAICIDQGTYDDKDKEKEKEDEKLNQILIMGKIYNSATSVLVWLGEATSSTKTGVWFMEQLRSSPTKYEGHYKGPNILKRLTQPNPSMAGIFDTLDFDSDLEAKIRALKPEQVTTAFRKYVDPAKLSVVRAGDFKAKK